MIRRFLSLALIRLLATGYLALFAIMPAFALDILQLSDSPPQSTVTALQQELYQDSENILTIGDILAGKAQFIPAWQDVINLGASDDSIWVHLRLENVDTDNEHHNWVMELAYARLARVDIYLTENGQLLQQANIGYEHPFTNRTLHHHYFAHPLALFPHHTYDLYLNVMRKGGGIQIPLRFYQNNAFTDHVSTNNYIYGLYFGVMFAMLVYNVFLLMSVGSRAYFYYILHIGFTSSSFLILYGYAFQYLWPNYPIINEYAAQLGSTAAGMAGLLFLRHYVELSRYPSWMNQAINAMQVLGVLNVVICLASHYPMIMLTAIYIGCSITLMLIISVRCWMLGSRPAGFFLFAWATFLSGVFIHILTMSAIVPTNLFTSNAIVLGSTIEVLLLSLGLADRINHERRARYLALQEKHRATMELEEAKESLIERAMHSSTTGMPNRTFLRTVLDGLCNQVTDRPITLLLISLDNFHEFNKTLGHSNGDAILNYVASQIEQATSLNQDVYTVENTSHHLHHAACIEGVTFAIILKNDSIESIEAFCRELQNTIEQPFDFQGLTLEVNISVGIARYPEHGRSGDELLRNAHIAVEMATNSGLRIALYSRDMDPYNARRISLLAELREAITHDGLQLYAQPQINLNDLSVTGAEVLVRWHHPEHGFISPEEFIPLAERTGVIHPLTFWVCRKTFEFHQQLKKLGIECHFSINISVRNLHTAGFTEQIADYARNAGISLNAITMELTETAVMIDREDALRVMNELAEIGIRLSVDDFGTGYSSLSYLKQLPVDEIKIDRSFIKDMITNKDDHVIVNTTLTMGHNLGLKVVAEGIEDSATLAALQSMGCDIAQGYHIAKPMPLEAFKQWLLGRIERRNNEAD